MGLGGDATSSFWWILCTAHARGHEMRRIHTSALPTASDFPNIAIKNLEKAKKLKTRERREYIIYVTTMIGTRESID